MPDKINPNILELEKMGIRKDLDSLTASIDKSNALNELRLVQIEQVAKDLATIVNGNGKEPGLAEKVRGIEGLFKHVYIIWIAVIGGIVDFIFRHLIGK